MTRKEQIETSISSLKTERLTIDNNRDGDFVEVVKRIMTPAVTGHLPNGWQSLESEEAITQWIEAREQDGCFLNIRMSNEVVGFCFLYPIEGEGDSVDLRFGYLLAESVWGKGIGTEFIRGLVNWCETSAMISSIAGGVEEENKGSIRVLQKTGFEIESENDGTVFYRRDFY